MRLREVSLLALGNVTGNRQLFRFWSPRFPLQMGCSDGMKQGMRAVLTRETALVQALRPWGSPLSICFGYKSVSLVQWWSRDIWFCFKKITLLYDYVNVRFMVMPGESQFFLDESLKETSKNIFPFKSSLKTSPWVSKLDNHLLIIAGFNHFFPQMHLF